MARMAGQDLAHKGMALEVAVQTLVSRVKAIKEILISNLIKVINNNSPVIRVIPSN